MRDLDRVLRCPSCSKLSHLPANVAEDVKAGGRLDEANDLSNSDSKLFKKTATTQSINSLHQESFPEDGDIRMNEIQCKAVL